MKKILICFAILFLLTGCSVDYQLTINDDLQIKERVVITGDASDSYWTTNEQSYQQYLTYFTENNSSYDIYSSNFSNNKYSTTFTSKYASVETFKKTCRYDFLYTKLEIDISDNIISFNVGGNSLIENEIEDEKINFPVTISVNSPFAIIESNATKVINNVMKWEFSQNNIKEIKFKLDKNIKNVDDKKNTFVIVNYIYYVLGGILLISLIVLIRKIKKSNKI